MKELYLHDPGNSMKFLLLPLALCAALAGCAYPAPYGPYYTTVPSYSANGSAEGAPNVVLAPGYGSQAYSTYPYGYSYPYSYAYPYGYGGYAYPYYGGYGYGYPYYGGWGLGIWYGSGYGHGGHYGGHNGGHYGGGHYGGSGGHWSGGGHR
jgi:hypothetical protein